MQQIYRPHSYQSDCIRAVVERPELGLFLDMSLGKTVITLTAIAELLARGEARRVLVVAPKRVAEVTWPDEVEKWAHLAHLRVARIAGTRGMREVAAKQDADVYIISRDNIAWLVETFGRAWRWDMLVLDELSSYKSPSSKRFKALRRVRPLVRRVVGLTGTPAPNTYMDLWSEVYLLDQGARLGRTLGSYRRQYFDAWTRGYYTEYQIKDGAQAAIDDKLRDLCISLKARDVLQLGEPQHIIAPARLSTREMDAYRLMAREAVLSVPEGEVTAANAAVVTGKLAQMAGGAVYTTDGTVAEIHSAKLDVLEELLEQAAGENVLIFTAYRHDMDRIAARVPHARRMETAQDIADWQAGKVRVMMAHPASCGHGLNLQSGGSIAIWFNLPWALELYLQANARLHRQGQTGAVRIYHILAEGTIDHDIYQSLHDKHVRQEALLMALRAHFSQRG